MMFRSKVIRVDSLRLQLDSSIIKQQLHLTQVAYLLIQQVLLEHLKLTVLYILRLLGKFIDVKKFDGLDIKVGDRIASTGNTRFGISVLSGLNAFTEGNRLYKVVGGVQQSSVYAIIAEVDIANNFLYVIPVQGTLQNGDVVGDYGTGTNFPVGYATITTTVVTAGAGAARVQDIEDVALNKRLYLSEVVGSFTENDGIKGPDNYKSAILAVEDIKSRQAFVPEVSTELKHHSNLLLIMALNTCLIPQDICSSLSMVSYNRLVLLTHTQRSLIPFSSLKHLIWEHRSQDSMLVN